MRYLNLLRIAAASLLFLAINDIAAQQKAPQHLFFHVTLSPQLQHPVSGRLLLFVSPGHGAKAVDMNMMSPTSVYMAAKEIASLAPGQTIDIDADDTVFPAPLSQAAKGDYEVQVVLDVAHSYNYAGRQPGDLISSVVDLQAWNPPTDTAPTLTLSTVVPPPPDPLAKLPEVNAALKSVDFVSPALSQFWGRDIHMKAWVLLPPGYGDHPQEHYPTVYFTHGFGGDLATMRARNAPVFYQRMKSGKMPPMIWVLLDESSPTGTHEFADGVNNGPWGTALTTELIPGSKRTIAWTREPPDASSKVIPLVDGPRFGYRRPTQKSLAAPGQPHPTPVTSTPSARSIFMLQAQTCIATQTALPNPSSGCTKQSSQRWSRWLI